MHSVDIKTLKYRISEYVRAAAAGEAVLVTEHSQVVAELVALRVGVDTLPDARILGDLFRQGLLTPARVPCRTPAATGQAREPDRPSLVPTRRRPGRALTA
jgi:antitoxin (DNA-binding transcriptional repressor) of toxin-antitoxin stability system